MILLKLPSEIKAGSHYAAHPNGTTSSFDIVGAADAACQTARDIGSSLNKSADIVGMQRG
jgi:hypothetical protein